jgi:hypothetical protein
MDKFDALLRQEASTLVGMETPPTKRPPLRTVLAKLIGVSGWLAAILVLDKIFHQGVIAYSVSLVILVGYVAWYFLSYWHSMGWLALPKRKRSY